MSYGDEESEDGLKREARIRPYGKLGMSMATLVEVKPFFDAMTSEILTLHRN